MHMCIITCVFVITEAYYQLTGAGWATGGIHLIAAHCHTLSVLNQNLQINKEKIYCCLIFRSGYTFPTSNFPTVYYYPEHQSGWLYSLYFHIKLHTGHHHHAASKILSPFLTGWMFVRPNILRTLWRTMIHFIIKLLVHRIWFGQSKLYFILDWLVMRCKLRPKLAADSMIKNVGSSQYTFIIPHRVIQLTTILFWVSETRLRLPQVNK